LRGNRYLVFAIVAPALFIGSVDNTIVAVGLSTFIDSLDTNLAVAAWTLTGSQLASTIVMPMAGKLSDDLGRKRVFLAAIMLFAIGSIGAGLSPNIYALIACRVLQALGSGCFMPSATGLIGDAFDGDDRRTALGLFASIFPLGGVVGPNVGGLVLEHFTWHWLFFITVPFSLTLAVVGYFALPADRQRERAERRAMDGLGAGFFGGSMFSVLFGMTYLANHPHQLLTPAPWLFIGLGVVMLWLFLRHEERTQAPLLDFELLRRPAFVAANTWNFLYGASLFGVFSLTPYYATVVYGMSPGESGALLTPRSIAMIAASAFSSFFLIRKGYHKPMIAGVLLVFVCLAMMGATLKDVTVGGVAIPDFWVLSFPILLGGLGMGISNPASANAGLDLVPDKMAAAAGMRGMFRNTGGVLGTAAITIALSQFDNKAEGFRDIFIFLAVAHLLLIPLTLAIPDTARDRRLNRLEVDVQDGTAEAAPAR
jgi:EmrB/QacA subfamily drug resistance transporter